MKKENFQKLAKNKVTLILLLILLIAFFIRVSLIKVNTAEWWDSADYMTSAKEFAGKVDLDTYEINPRRPFFLMILWGSILGLGLGDVAMRFSVIVFALLGIYFTYLIGKKMFNEYAGLIGAFLLAVNWLHIFHSVRLLTDIIAMTWWLVTAYYFWKYLDEDKGKYLVLSGVFFGFTVFTRAASLIMIVPMLAALFFKEKFNIVKNKNAWLAVLMVFLVMSPFIIWLFATYDNPVEKFTGIGGGEQRFAGRWQFSYLWKNLPAVSTTILSPGLTQSSAMFYGVLFILITLYLLWDVFLGFDILWKEGSKDLLKKLYLLVWIGMPYVFYSLAGAGVEHRYLISMFPAMFILFGDGLVRLGNLLSKKWKYLGLILILVVILPIGYSNYKYGVSLTVAKSSSYAEVALAGQWIRERSTPEDNVISASVFQNMYYSERNTHPFVGRGMDKDNERLCLERLEEINP
ncbi:MAG: glycosyltransferase family 39 protein [Nanoarchaeota archaeon]